MKREEWKDILETIGVIAIVASLIFVALEIRTNTQSNEIAIEQNYASNWLIINSQIAGSSHLAEIIAKGRSGVELSDAEFEQVAAYIRMLMSQSFHMLRLYDQGLISSSEVRGAFRALRDFASSSAAFRSVVEGVDDTRRREMILEPDGLDKWLEIQ